RLVPPGATGEVFVAGAGVAAGYLGRPGLTAERFVANPFGPGRMYRTGDLARWARGKELEYAGRADSQVQVRGVRIELGEIETVLAAHPQAGQVAVVARDDDRAGTRLAAYTTGTATSGQLREHAAAHLPGYMIPALFTPIPALPLTPN